MPGKNIHRAQSFSCTASSNPNTQHATLDTDPTNNTNNIPCKYYLKMTLNSQIEVFFHMRNHYKKLKHAKSVVDCSAPKGRSRKDAKSPRRVDRKKDKSANRPPTRRNPKDMPHEVPPKESLPPLIKTKDGLKEGVCKIVEVVSEGCNQHEYLEFSLRITEDIIKNDLYTNDQMRQVLTSHYEANKGRLDNDRMMSTLLDLCKELNISFCECDATAIKTVPNTSCICNNETIPNVDCECGNERNPPIKCNSHSDENEYNNDDLAIEQQENQYSTSKHKCDCGAESCESTKCQILEVEQYLLKKHESQQGSAADISEVDKHVSIENADMKTIDDENEITQKTNEVDKIDKTCNCTNENCNKDRLFVFLEHFEKKISQPKHIHEFGISHYSTSIEPKKTDTNDLSVQTSQPVFIGSPEKAVEIVKPEEPIVQELPSTATDTAKTNTENEETANKPGNVICICNHNHLDSQPTCREQSDFIIFEGPVLIPKMTIHNVDTLNKLTTPRNVGINSVNPTQDGHMRVVECTEIGINTQTVAPPEFVIPEQQNVYNSPTINKPNIFTRNYDYDLTPQKDTLLHENIKCQNIQCTCNCVRTNNLLLGSQYDNCITQDTFDTNKFIKYNKYYPTIATQVSSMELLKYHVTSDPKLSLPQPSKQQENNESLQRQTPVLEQPILLDEQILMNNLRATTENRDSNLVQGGDILKRLDRVPDACSTESMEKRIELLRMEMEKFRAKSDDESPYKVDDALQNYYGEQAEKFEFGPSTDTIIQGNEEPKSGRRVSIANS